MPPKAFLLRLGNAVTAEGGYDESRALLERVRSMVASRPGVEFLGFEAGR